ncbi:MAG: LuxR C-terminal-related transcriptional regulator [Candidatus Acidiferrum sp.]
MNSGGNEAASNSELDAMERMANGNESFASLLATKVGIATIDESFRYRAINDVLASTNGLPAKAHIGKTVREILGSSADEVEPNLRRAFGKGENVIFPVAARLPRSLATQHWILNYIPIKDSHDRVSRVCAIVVEVTEKKIVEDYLFKLTGKLLYLKARLARKGAARGGKASHRPQTLKLLQECAEDVMEMLKLVQTPRSRSSLKSGEQKSLFSQAELPKALPPLKQLSRRETEVLRLLASNKSNKEASEELGISVRTVESHRRRLMEKLGLHSMGELIHLAIRNGIVEA